jgi:hypothetical protein
LLVIQMLTRSINVWACLRITFSSSSPSPLSLRRLLLLLLLCPPHLKLLLRKLLCKGCDMR